jgi:hypothetical protein
MALTSDGNYRRNYPRRPFKRMIGVLFKGHYFLAQAGEIGEGGLSLKTDLVLTEEEPLMVSFQIPNGDFVCLRAIVKSTQKNNKPEEGATIIHGLSFSNVQFAIKRQIRSYVSSRSL